MKVSVEEITAVKQALEAGERFGYGNVMAHLATAWARNLVDKYGLTEKAARQGSLHSGMPYKMQDDILNEGFWDETGKRYKERP